MKRPEQISVKLARAEGLLKGTVAAFEHVLHYNNVPEHDVSISMNKIRKVEDEILSLLKSANELCNDTF